MCVEVTGKKCTMTEGKGEGMWVAQGHPPHNIKT